MTTVRVHVESTAGTVPVGTARVDRLRGIETTEFTYDQSFMAGEGWELSPDLPLLRSGLVVDGLPGALDDAAPDAWGRSLITRQLAARARDRGHPTPTPTEAEHLLAANDLTRQGALRFCIGDGPFLSEGAEVPRLVELETLLGAARRVAAGDDADEAVATLLAAGSGSLGGARPKAAVSDGGVLHIAKFPRSDDRWEVMRWEAVGLDLATECGIRTPDHQLIELGPDPVLLVRRFDRAGDRRVPYLSARSLVGARDGSVHDYLELVDGLTEHGGDVSADLAELWRRVALSIAIHNTDDHLRNHALLRDRRGWTLSPVFDVNPDPRPTAPRVTSVAGATAPEPCRQALFADAASFGLSPTDATMQWREVLGVVGNWRQVAARNGITESEQDMFAPVLDRWDG